MAANRLISEKNNLGCRLMSGQLIDKTRWGNTVRINLADGTVWKD